MNALERMKILFRRAKNGSIKKMQYFANEIHRETGKPSRLILADMCLCAARYGIGYQEYRGYGFVSKSAELRKTFMTVNNNVALTREANKRELYPILEDKGQFLKKYHEFINRDWLDTRECTRDDFIEFVKKHDTFFVKPINLSGGNGISKVSSSRIDAGKYYDLIMKNNSEYIIEETIIQHHEMNKINPNSVNTLRMVTLLKDGEPKYLYTILRAGQGSAVVDNAGSGGVYTYVDSDGVCRFPFYDEKKGLTLEEHPTTKMKIQGFEIPMFDEAVDYVMRAALVEPDLGYIGWDVAITEEGPTLVEGNLIPGFDMAQNLNWHPDGKGILPLMEEAWGGPLPR
ncbi:MAG: hypothetical protein IJG49_06460 [Erysipelotrichaceae bacterium]|nr:hypothetical protein [Erysipelotrichaceae bacterium]